MIKKLEPPSSNSEIVASLRSSRFYRGRTAICSRCGSQPLQFQSPNQYLCGNCRRQTNPIKGSWLASARVPIQKSVLLVWYFAQGEPALTASRSLGLSYPAVLRFYSRIREATLQARWILKDRDSLEDASPDEVFVIAETTIAARQGERKRGRVVRGSRASRGVKPLWASVSHAPDARAARPQGGRGLPQAKPQAEDAPCPKSARGTGKSCRAILRAGAPGHGSKKRDESGMPNVSIAIGMRNSVGVRITMASADKTSERKVTVWKRQEMLQYLNRGSHDMQPAMDGNTRFWKLARRHMRRFRGITADKLPQYLGEFAFRANHGGHDLFKALLEILLAPIPR